LGKEGRRGQGAEIERRGGDERGRAGPDVGVGGGGRKQGRRNRAVMSRGI